MLESWVIKMVYKNVHRNKLHQELIEGGIDVNELVVQAIDKTEIGADIQFKDGIDMELVQTIIDNHNPSFYLPRPSEVEVLKSDIDFNKMVTETQQSEIDFLKLTGGI